jgi:hypothetical protein
LNAARAAPSTTNTARAAPSTTSAASAALLKARVVKAWRGQRGLCSLEAALLVQRRWRTYRAKKVAREWEKITDLVWRHRVTKELSLGVPPLPAMSHFEISRRNGVTPVLGVALPTQLRDTAKERAEAQARVEAQARAEEAARAAEEARAAKAKAELNRAAAEARARTFRQSSRAITAGGAARDVQSAARHAFALHGTWNESNATGYTDVGGAPQFRLVPDFSLPEVVFTLTGGNKGPCMALACVKAHSRGCREVGQPRTFSKFTNVSSELRLPIEAGAVYTLIVCSYSEGLKPEEIELDWSVTLRAASPEALLFREPIAPVTLTMKEVLESDARAARLVEGSRRSASLAAFKQLALASPAGSTLRESWEDFCAAEKEVERIKAGVPRGQKWKDGWSGSSASIGPWDEGKKCEWVDLLGIAPHPAVVEGGYALEDVQQGALGDCYFLAVLAELAASGGAREGLLSSTLDAAFVTGEYNSQGVYCVRFWVRNKWVHVFVDGLLPCQPGVYIEASDPKTRYTCTKEKFPHPGKGRFSSLFGVNSTSMNELWPSLLEKAWAKLHGSYGAIEGNKTTDHFPVNFFVPHSLPGFQQSVGEGECSGDALWGKLCTWQSRGWPITACSRSAVESASTGIVKWHAYSLLRLFPPSAGESRDAPKLLQLRNPHGHGEWQGAFSDKDAASWTPSLKQATGYDPATGGDDGIFWMSLPDFERQFKSVSITPLVRLVKDGGSWVKREVRGCLTPQQCAAAAGFGESQWLEKLLSFPQYLVFAAGEGAEFTVSIELEEMSAEGKTAGLPEVAIHPFFYLGGTGVTPAVLKDNTCILPAKPVLSPQKWTFFSSGRLSITQPNAPAGSSLIFILELRKPSPPPREPLFFTLSILTENPFTLRCAQPGGMSTQEGVLCVSDPLP